MGTTEEFISAGLFDPATMADTGRLELLHWLTDCGFTIDEMVAALESLSLGAMAGDRELLRDRRLDRAGAIDRSGLDAEQFDQTTTALGYVTLTDMPGVDDDHQWGVSDADAFGEFGALGAMFSREEAVGFVRVIGSALARIGDAAVSLFLNDVESRLLTDGASELAVAQRVHEATQLIEGVGQQLEPVLRRHVLQSVQRTREATIGLIERFNYRYAIGFVDLVGFTEISSELDSRALAAFIREFEGGAHDAVTAEGARVVKLIGDEVMFASTDPAAACRAAAALMEGFGTDDERVLPRAGVAFGDVLVRGGDFYGPVVNLASRLVDEAVPQEVLVTASVAEAVDTLTFDPAGRRMVKGFAEPVVVHSLRTV